jgi:hypothetical protein
MVGIFATALLVASETTGVVTTATWIGEKKEPQAPPNITGAGKTGKNLCSFQSSGRFFF